MKIVICGSVVFADKMKEVAEKLEQLGHQIELPFYVKKIIAGEVSLADFIKVKDQSGDSGFRAIANEDLIKRYYRLIGQSDAILVVNIDKKGVKNYIGGNTLMEIGFAYVLDKKIFLLNDVPEIDFLKDEILAVKPIVINDNLSLIK